MPCARGWSSRSGSACRPAGTRAGRCARADTLFRGSLGNRTLPHLKIRGRRRRLHREGRGWRRSRPPASRTARRSRGSRRRSSRLDSVSSRPRFPRTLLRSLRPRDATTWPKRTELPESATIVANRHVVVPRSRVDADRTDASKRARYPALLLFAVVSVLLWFAVGRARRRDERRARVRDLVRVASVDRADRDTETAREMQPPVRGTPRTRPVDSRNRARRGRARARRPAQEPDRAAAPLRAGAGIPGARDRLRRRMAGLRPRRRTSTTAGSYAGFDVSPAAIGWLNENLAPRLAELPLRPRRRTRIRGTAPTTACCRAGLVPVRRPRVRPRVRVRGVHARGARTASSATCRRSPACSKPAAPRLLELHGGDAPRRVPAERLARVRRGRAGRVHVASRSARAGRWRTTTR